MSEQNITQQQLIARAMKDETFRQQLLANPRAVLEREMGITFPQDVSIQVYEDTPTTIHLVLPAKPQGETVQELSDAELEMVAGGADAINCASRPGLGTCKAGL